MDIMDLNELRLFSDSIEQELNAIENVLPNDAEYTELVTLHDHLYTAWIKFDSYLYNLSATWHDKEE